MSNEGIPSCVGQDYSGFISPDGGISYSVGEELNITWYGAHAYLDGTYTSIWDMTLHHSNDTGWEYSVFESRAYVYESNRPDRDGTWTNYNLCGDSAYYQLWTIPGDLDFSSTEFILIAYNVTTDDEDATFTSGPFMIEEPEQTSSTFLPSSTNASNDAESPIMSDPVSTTNSSPTPDPKPTGELSTGAKAGIGIGVALGVIMVLLGTFLFYRRKRHRNVPNITAYTDEGNQKPELDGQAVKRPMVEADGAEIVEADAGSKLVATVKSLPQDPVELPTERFDRGT